MSKLYLLVGLFSILSNIAIADDINEYTEKNTKCNKEGTECTDLNGNQITGIRKTYYENGSVKDIDNFKNGKAEGSAKRYYENGALKSEMSFKNGKAEGIRKTYYENGTLKTEIIYSNNKPNGILKDYDENGNLKGEIPFKNGKAEGFVRQYFENQLVKEESKFKNDVKEYHKMFHENGELYHKCVENKDIINVELYCTHGEKMITYSLKNGKMTNVKYFRSNEDPCLKQTLEKLNKESKGN